MVGRGGGRRQPLLARLRAAGDSDSSVDRGDSDSSVDRDVDASDNVPLRGAGSMRMRVRAWGMSRRRRGRRMRFRISNAPLREPRRRPVLAVVEPMRGADGGRPDAPPSAL